MHRDVARDVDQLERFRREARAIAKLSSPHVVGVIDAGEEDDGTPFIVLEYVEGETLKDRIRRMGRLPVTATLDPLEVLTPSEEHAGADYFTAMRENLASLRKALGCR